MERPACGTRRVSKERKNNDQGRLRQWPPCGVRIVLTMKTKQFSTHGYEYSVDLRMHHPSIDPKLISRKLRMRPVHSWRVGDRRMTPAGTQLEGHRQDSYWSKPITPKWVRVPSGNTAEDKIAKLIERLRPHTRFLKHFRTTGGRVEIWLSSYSTRNYCFVLSPRLVESIQRLGCELILDIYPYQQN